MIDGGDGKGPSDLGDLGRRLKQARKPERKGDQQQTRGAALGFGFRIAVDLVCAVAVGFGLGYVLDWWLGTSPWFLLFFVPLGIVAGILNVVRAAQSEEAKRQAGIVDGQD